MSMLELSPSEFDCTLPLLSGIQQAVLPYAICQGINPGRIFVDERTNPRTALVWTPVGYYLLAGKPDQVQDLAAISQVLTDVFVPASQAGGETGFILMPSDDGWSKRLPALLPGREIIEIYRRPFAFDQAKFTALGGWRDRIPPGFRLQALDAPLAEQAGALSSWASIEDFLAHGLGFALLDGNEVASLCSSVFSSREKVEIDVHTSENYRRQGLASITTAALIEACLQAGKLPNWECFWDNDPSTALANHLGFTPLPDYPVYYWEEAGTG
jgi:GNAT superfamily N-acetyltransferase